MPNGDTPQLKDFSRRLLAYEAAAGKRTGADGPVAFRVCERLREPLCKLIGVGGFRTLFSRALALAGTEVRWLRALHIKSDGSLEGLGELEAKLSEDEIAVGEVALVGQLLGLLVTFIGPALALGLVQEAWPKAAFNTLNFGKGEKP